MKKLFALMLAVLMIATVFCACGKETVDCEACREKKDGKAYKVDMFGVEMTVCKDCKEEYDAAMGALGNLDLGDLGDSLGDLDLGDLLG